MNIFINVQGIGMNYYITSQFIHINIFIKAIDKTDNTVIIHMCKKFHVINDLKANMLISTNILKMKNIDLKFFINEMIFINYKNFMISMQIQYKDNILHIPFSI